MARLIYIRDPPWLICADEYGLGIAIRIMQALHSQRVSPYPLDPASERDNRDAVTVAIETRTYWACFIMDCMVNSGTYNPPMLPMSEMHKLKIARPLSAVEFAFGPEPPPSIIGGIVSSSSPAGVLDITRSFEILVGGFEIWAKVMEFIFNDGRKAPGMCAPHNCPWVPGSPWSMSWNQLKAWRAGQHRNLHYPSTSVAVHMTLGYGETFVYLNLLYYVRWVSLAAHGDAKTDSYRAPSCFIASTHHSCQLTSRYLKAPWRSRFSKLQPRRVGGRTARQSSSVQQRILHGSFTRHPSVASP